MYALLKYCCANGCMVNTSPHADNDGSLGQSRGGKGKISAFGFSDEVTIHHVGKTNGTQRKSSTPYRRSLALLLMEDPPLAQLPLHDGEQQNDSEEQHRQGRAVAEGVELERLLVQVV